MSIFTKTTQEAALVTANGIDGSAVPRLSALICQPFVLERGRVGESNCGGVRLSFHSRLLLLLLPPVVGTKIKKNPQ